MLGTPYSGYTAATTDCANTLPSSPSPTSLGSIHNRQSFNFWKAGSQTPLSASSSSSSFFRPTQRCLLAKVLKVIWRYLKWPLGLLMICGLLGLVVYFLVVGKASDRDIMSSGLLGEDGYEVDENLSVDFNDFTSTNDLRFDHRFKEPKPKDPPGPGRTVDTKFSFGLDNDLLAVFGSNGKKPSYEWTPTTAATASPPPTTDRQRPAGESASEEQPALVVKVTEAPVRKTSTISLKDYTKARVVFDDDDFLDADDGQSRSSAPASPRPEGTTRAYEPAAPTIQVGHGGRGRTVVRGFTSGHQNNFGVPIEEDERLLRQLNDQLMQLERLREKNVTVPSATTDSSLYRTKVSPTLPILSRFEITTEGLKRFNISEEGICQSTSLPLCRGVLPYDLTVSNNRQLSALEFDHFQYLINSKCSVRVAEFVCLVLEPECRPTRMGTLTPCKRICKCKLHADTGAILEPCAHIIASSEALTATFDCDSYPDSDDRNVCEDPTRLGQCYANEFRCADSSCIPLQWKCDNIKDCQGGEDESDCKQCERDEYRCMSNDKCIPDKWRCDQYEDCPDASDELDCYYDEPTTFPTAYGSQREYPFVQVQVPNSPNGRPYITITNEDRTQAEAQRGSQEVAQAGAPREYANYGTSEEDDDGADKYEPTAAENAPHVNRHRNRTETDVGERKTDGESTTTVRSDEARIEDQTEAETSRTISVPKSLVNFQDSKEIMMTSDSENDFKISSTSRDFLTTAHVSPCPEGELRCVSGICISVSQLCDRVADCADGADEAGCTYKD
uniref:FZ domain-containing protein n=1 Tax=Anopheles dirus TaxID=7168 RepID=A0A182NPC2_9DIPT